MDTQTYESRYGKSAASHPDRSSVSANDPTEVYHGTSSKSSIPQTTQEVNPETGIPQTAEQETVAADPEMVYHRFKEIETTIVGMMKWYHLIDPDLDGYHETMKILSRELRFHYERKSRNK